MEGHSGGTMIDYSIPYAMENRNTAEESYQIYVYTPTTTGYEIPSVHLRDEKVIADRSNPQVLAG